MVHARPMPMVHPWCAVRARLMHGRCADGALKVAGEAKTLIRK
jgi:hypothetical protein